jgi:circadian clock protein KaiB
MGETPLEPSGETLAEGAREPKERYKLRLYVTGASARSGRAIENVRALCDRYLEGRYDLEVIDIYQQPDLAEVDHILVAPTLVRHEPRPRRRFVGDLSDDQRVLGRLNLLPAA